MAATMEDYRDRRVMDWLNKYQANLNPESRLTEAEERAQQISSGGSRSQNSVWSQGSQEDDSFDSPSSPHYDPERISDEEASVIIDTPFDPADLAEKLKFCPICKEQYPNATASIQCVKNHKKYLCFFCFELMDADMTKMTKHYRKMKHYCDQTEYAVKCPFSECTTPAMKYSFIFGIQNHILRMHLPQQYSNADVDIDEEMSIVSCEEVEKKFDRVKVDMKLTISRSSKKEAEMDEEDDKKLDRCFKLENTYDKMKEELVMMIEKLPSEAEELEEEDEADDYEEAIRKRLDTFYETPEEEEDMASDIPESKTVVDPGPFYTCSFCDKVFMYRKGLTNHNIQRKCEKIQDKRCHGCDQKFKGSSIIQTIGHLLNCPRSHRFQRAKRPRWSKRKKQIVFH